MRIVIDGLPLLGEVSIAGYLRELLLHLAAETERHEYCLFFRGFRAQTYRQATRLVADPTFARFQAQITRVPDRFLEWCWTHHSWYLPLMEAWLGVPDVFLSTVYMTPVFRRAAVVMIAYDLIPLRFPQFYGQDQPLLPLRIRRSIERADAIIAISECTKQDYVELLHADPARIHVVYQGVDSRFCPVVDPIERDRVLAHYGILRPYVLYVGVLAPHKNVQTLVRVFRRLKRSRGLPHQLVLCGRAKWGHAVVQEAHDLIATGECSVLDFIPDHDVPYLYHGASALAFFSLYEGFGRPPLEAMACGVPVVASNAASLPEVVGDAGLLVSPTDEGAIEEALYRVLTDTDLRQELRTRGFRQAARFSWAEAARQTLAICTMVGKTP